MIHRIIDIPFKRKSVFLFRPRHAVHGGRYPSDPLENIIQERLFKPCVIFSRKRKIALFKGLFLLLIYTPIICYSGSKERGNKP